MTGLNRLELSVCVVRGFGVGDIQLPQDPSCSPTLILYPALPPAVLFVNPGSVGMNFCLGRQSRLVFVDWKRYLGRSGQFPDRSPYRLGKQPRHCQFNPYWTVPSYWWWFSQTWSCWEAWRHGWFRYPLGAHLFVDSELKLPRP